MCAALAKDYAEMGVSYASSRLYNVVEAGTLAAIHRDLPAIERASGVTLRFLVGAQPARRTSSGISTSSIG